MKRLISVLVLVAMMLASVLAMFPVSADEVAEEVIPGAPVATYDVNWKKLVNRGVMKGQWCFAASETYNNFENFYNITATDTAFETSYKGTSIQRQYYSTQMFDITADTHYEYVFEVKNNPDRPTGTAGVVFAFAINENLYVENGDFKDFEGTAQAPYWLNGEFGNDSDSGEHFEVSVNCGWQADEDSGYVLGYKSGSSAGCDVSAGTGVAKINADGYSTFKVVYNGLDVSFFYLDANDAWVEIFAGRDSVLPEGSKVTFGVYNRDNRMAFLRNCKLYAMDDATALVMAKNAATYSIAAGDKEIAKGGYTTTTTAALTTALEAAKALVADEAATSADLIEATANVETAIDGLLVGAIKTALVAKIAEAEAALTEDKFADKAELWAAYAEKLAAAKALAENVDALQPETDAMVEELRAAMIALIGADKAALAAKIDEVQAIDFDKYYPISWAPVAKAFVEAKKLNASDVAFQADIDAALAALEAALPGVKEKPAVKVYDYTVNWALFLEYGILRSQWWNDAAEGQNIYLNKYTVEATANSLSSTAKGDGDNHTYYSRVMYEITENTYYEYTFKAKNNSPYGSVGVMFAYDTSATNTHFIYGYFDNTSNGTGATNFRIRAGHHGYPDRNPPSHDANNDPQYTPVVSMTEDGYGQYKFVYDGFNFSFHYLNADGRYEMIGDIIVLPAGAKVCPGVYTKGKNTANLKDAVLSAFNAEDALRIAIADANYALNIGKAEANTGKYTPETTKALTDAIAAVEAEIAKAAEADPATIVALTAPVLAATKALVNKKALDAKIAEIEAEALVQADWTTVTWTAFAAALEAAKTESANTETTQANVDKALKALTDARKALDPSAEGDKTALNAKIEEAEAAIKAEDFTAEEKAELWAKYAAALEAAKKVSADKTEFGNQTATDKALKELKAAIVALIAADKTALNNAIKSANELVEGKYESGWADFATALAAAKVVAASDVAFQADVDSALEALNGAIAALVRKPLELKATYNVNWKYMYENKLMKAQWWNETWQNDFEDHFTVNATEDMLNVVSKKKDESDGNLGDTRAYYGTNMYKITATTYYEYTFKVKHDSVRSTYAGVIFAYDTTSNPDNQLAYIFYGGLANLSDDGANSYISIQYGHQDAADRVAGPVKQLVVGTDADGFATYKIVYDGYFAHFFYTDPTTGEFIEMPTLRTKLKETAAVCFGTYTRENRDNTNVADPRTVTQKNGVLVAMNDEAAGYMLVNKADLAAKIAEVKAMNENEYTSATWAIVTEALAAAEAVNADVNAFQVMVDNALTALNSAIAKLGKPGDATALKAKIAEAEALKAEDYKSGLAWNMFQKAIKDAKDAAESRDSTQGDIDMQLALLVEAMSKIEKKPAPVTPPAETEKPTDATEKPTEATEEPTEDKGDDEEPVEEGCGGCGSSAAISAIAIVSVIGTAIAFKKKED